MELGDTNPEVVATPMSVTPKTFPRNYRNLCRNKNEVPSKKSLLRGLVLVLVMERRGGGVCTVEKHP